MNTPDMKAVGQVVQEQLGDLPRLVLKYLRLRAGLTGALEAPTAPGVSKLVSSWCLEHRAAADRIVGEMACAAARLMLEQQGGQ